MIHEELVDAICRRIKRVADTTRMPALVYVWGDGEWWVSYEGPKDVAKRRRYEEGGAFVGAYTANVEQARLWQDLQEHINGMREEISP